MLLENSERAQGIESWSQACYSVLAWLPSSFSQQSSPVRPICRLGNRQSLLLTQASSLSLWDESQT